MISEVNQKQDMILPIVQQNQRAIFGYNGDPGLRAIVNAVVEDAEKNQAEINTLKKAIFGDPENRQDMGIQGDLDELKKDRGKRERIIWATVSSLVTIVTGGLAQAILNVILK